MDDNTTRSNFLWYDSTWPIFCAWHESLQLCNRISCAGAQFPECENGAVRRPLFDLYDATPQSICNAWYCDCTTVHDVETAHWTVTAINSSYDVLQNNAPLTAAYLPTTVSLCLCARNANSTARMAAPMTPRLAWTAAMDVPWKQRRFALASNASKCFGLRVSAFWLITTQSFENATMSLCRCCWSILRVDSISIWQIEPDDGKSIVFFRYLFDTDDETVAQGIGGDLMLLAHDQVSDDTSTAARGFVMSRIDSSYEFTFCIPTHEECDPERRPNFNLIFLVCFLASFAFLTIAFIVYRVLTRKRREREYEEQIAEQKRVLQELESVDHNLTRIGMRDVSRGRAQKVAEDKKDWEEMEREKQQKTAILSEAFSLNEPQDWVQHIAVEDQETLEMQPPTNDTQQEDHEQDYEEYEYGE